MTTQPKPRAIPWKLEFDERFSVFDGSQKIIKHVTYSRWIKDFINALLSRREQEVREKILRKILGMKREYPKKGVTRLFDLSVRNYNQVIAAAAEKVRGGK